MMHGHMNERTGKQAYYAMWSQIVVTEFPNKKKPKTIDRIFVVQKFKQMLIKFARTNASEMR